MTDAILDWIIVRTELDQRDKTDGFDVVQIPDYSIPVSNVMEISW